MPGVGGLRAIPGPWFDWPAECKHAWRQLEVAAPPQIHGVDERISIEDFHRGIGFYVRLVELAAGDESSSEACSQEACSQE